MKTSGTRLCSGLFTFILFLVHTVSNAQLKADFTSNVQSGCAPLVVAFQDKSTGNPTNLTWTLGNGTIATNNSQPATTYFDPGTYTVKLSIKNASGKDSITKTSYITVYSSPQVSFNATPTLGCFPLDVKYTNNSKAGSGTISEILWDFGDGNIDTASNASHTYTSAGTFDITLKVTNSYGCYNALTKSDFIVINNGVNADFSLTSLNVCNSPAVAVFQNSSDGSGALSYKWDFGDGQTSTAESPSHSYANSGNYKVLLTVRSSAGCSDTASYLVNAHIPTSTFSYGTATCLNQTIHFTNTSLPTPVSCTWYFGDGTISHELNPDKSYAKTGNYTVKLVNVFSSSCSDSTSTNITIYAGPTAIFVADDTSKCAAPFSVNFTNKTTGAASSFVWNFGDGSKTSSDLNPNHIYTKQGNYNVTLTAINSNGCQAVLEKQKYISIQPVKITGFKNLPDSGCTPLIVKPSALLNINAKIQSYNWDFGDGGTSTAELPTHTYTKDGFFTVTLTIETEDGCTNTFSLPNAVIAGHKPKAGLTPTKDSICKSDFSMFLNSSTNGPITYVSWDGGKLIDSVSGEYYFKNFYDTGYQKITLIVYNYGCSDTLRKDSVIYVRPPVSKIEFTTHCDDKLRIDFIDSSISDISRTWNFGDGNADNTKNPVHRYTTPGDYTINLYTVNNTCRDTASTVVHVINEVGSIFLDKKTYCRGNAMTADITGIKLANIKYTTWDFGDGTVTTVNGITKASHTYTVTGKFKVKATMIDKNNCQYEYETSDSIAVSGPLAAFFKVLNGACEGSSITFNDRSSSDGVHNILKWSWNFGEGDDQNYTSYTSAFSHTYNDTGYKTISLSVTDTYGCTDTIKKVNYVLISKPVASFTVSDSIVCPGKQVSFQNNSNGIELDYSWNFGDGIISALETPYYTYRKSGVYNPQLFVTDVNGCKDSMRFNGLTISKPVASFNLSDSVSTCPPLEVNFTNQSTYFASSTWDFGDGSPSIVNSPTHIYTYPGVYPVKLIVKGYGSCADTALIKNITIKGPTGTFTYDSIPACYPATTKFKAIAKNVVLYTWDFSDGNTAATGNANTSYQYQPGNYVPKLILQDAAGCAVSIKGKDTLKIFNVVGNASVATNISCDLNPVQFTDLSTSQDNITHHYWHFGDDSLTDQKNVTHAYAKKGLYNVYVITETKLGCRDTFNIPAGVQILPTPKINIISDSAACASASVNYNATSAVKDSTLQWNWNFGNGNKLTGQNVTTVYNNGGSYTVNLIASNSGGCADTATKSIIVHTAPNVKAGNDTAVCQGGNFQLNATGAQTYTWSGSGLSCNNCSSPNIKPAALSKYVVTGKDAIGCSNSDSITINVISPVKVSVSNADTLCVGGNTKLNVSGASSYQWFPALYLDNDKSAQPVFTAAKDTLITYKVVGYTAQNCFADTGYVSVKTYPVPKLNIEQNNIVLNVGSSVQLHANGSSDITTYRWEPPQGLNSITVANPVASPAQSTTYACVASNGGSCVSRDEITINVICGSGNVYIPNTFSPNNDGMNDMFYPRGNGLFKIKSFKIFNRWGQIVFEKSNATPNSAMDGWDGNYNGKPLNADVYVYMIEVLCNNNFTIPFKGNITLIR